MIKRINVQSMSGTISQPVKGRFPNVKRMGATDRQWRLQFERHSPDTWNIELRDYKHVSTYARAFSTASWKDLWKEISSSVNMS